MQLRAFNGLDDVKAFFLGRVTAHARSGRLVKGLKMFWTGEQGDAIGCTVQMEQNGHKSYEELLGIPEELAYLEDTVFENLPDDQALSWPTDFLKAIVVGSDLSKVAPQMMLFLLTDPEAGVLRFSTTHAGVTAAINRVADLYKTSLGIGIDHPVAVAQDVWQQAADFARSMADSQHGVKVSIRPERAAPSGAGKAWSAAAWSAWAEKAFLNNTPMGRMQAVAAAAWTAVRAAEMSVDGEGFPVDKPGADAALAKSPAQYVRIAGKLIELIKVAPVPAKV